MDPTAHADDRREMVKSQLMRRGIRSPAVLEAMGRLPRELFLPSSREDEAYGDHAVNIACSQTMSQPYMVALMTEALELGGQEKVLEIGTGSGYQTAILASLARNVISMERHGELSLQAQRVLAQLGLRNVRLVIGDGTRGFPAEAPFDRIVVTAAAPQVPEPLLEQLADGGILVIPVGAGQSQVLQSIRRSGDERVVTQLSGCRFVPLVTG
jgi:protein-L-isoaspartate(D-aspartate) O-methyltransferase